MFQILLAIIKPSDILVPLSDINNASDVIKCLDVIAYSNDVVWCNELFFGTT